MAKPSVKELARVVLALSADMSSEVLAKSMAEYLQAEHRSNELDLIMRHVRELRRKRDGITEADVTTAFPVDSSTVAVIKEIFGQHMIINKIIDKRVIGGVRVETNEEYLDLTVRNRLNQLKGIKQGVAIT